MSRITEVNDVSTRMSGTFDESGITDPYLVSTFTELKARNVKLTLAINRSKAENNLETNDEIRDDTIRALFYMLLSFSHQTNKEMREAALVLLKVFNKYGMDLINESYSTESSLISSMLLDFGKPEYKAAIGALAGCSDLMESLAIAQHNFEESRIAYETEKTMLGMEDNATVLKKEVLEIINNKIVVYLRAMLQANPETFVVFTNIIAEIIASNNEQVKKRKKKPETEPASESQD